jgi:hypothetical protein
MKNKKIPQNEKELLIALIKMSIQDVPKTQEDIDELLIDGGLDPKKVRENGAALLRKIKQPAKTWRDTIKDIEKSQIEYDKQKEKYSSYGRQDLLDRINELIQNQTVQIGFAFRNQEIEQMGESDLRSLVQQLEMKNDSENDIR